MKERTQDLICVGRSKKGIRLEEQVFWPEWVRILGLRKKMESQPGYFCHSELGVQVVKRMPEQKLGRYQNETKQKREVIYARSLWKRLRNEAKRLTNVSHEEGQREEQRKNGRC
jgi:hypothetical protein